MGFIGKYCPQCGYGFPGQRTGKCPNCDCDESTIIRGCRLYKINPREIKRFKQLDKNGGMLKAAEAAGRRRKSAV